MVITNSVLEKEIIGKPKTIQKEFEILNHGQFYAGRGYDIMAKANQLLINNPDIHLAIRGFGVLEKEIHDIVDHSPNADSFKFYPKVSVEELIPLATKSAVGVAITEPICLNFKLSVSNKLFEYAAAGLPVILSDIPEHRYLNNKYNFGLILKEDSPEEFIRTVLELYSSPELYSELSRNALYMSKEICWESQFRELVRFERKMQ